MLLWKSKYRGITVASAKNVMQAPSWYHTVANTVTGRVNRTGDTPPVVTDYLAVEALCKHCTQFVVTS